jgi:hypothetical protein
MSYKLLESMHGSESSNGSEKGPDLATACTYLIDTLPTPASESRTLAESTMLGHRIGHCEVQAELSC